MTSSLHVAASPQGAAAAQQLTICGRQHAGCKAQQKLGCKSAVSHAAWLSNIVPAAAAATLQSQTQPVGGLRLFRKRAVSRTSIDGYLMLDARAVVDNTCALKRTPSLWTLQVLEQAQLQRQDIDRVLLVGGSTRIPAIRAILHEYFGDRVELNHQVQLPTSCVAVRVSVLVPSHGCAQAFLVLEYPRRTSG